MITKILTATLITLFSTQAFSFADEGSSQRLSNTQGASTSSPLESKYSSLIRQVDAYHATGSVNCNTSYNDSAHALICNCANEAGHEPLSGKTKVTQVVLSRVKSTSFPNSVRGVVCQRKQFSWTIGLWNSNCQRNNRRNSRSDYFSTPRVRGEMLNSCVSSIKLAAKEELLSTPDRIFATNYCSRHPSAYRGGYSAMPGWCRTLVASGGCDNSHCFGVANPSHRQVLPPAAASSIVVDAKDIVYKLLGIQIGHAVTEDTKIVNTESKQKIYLDDQVKKILKQKHPNFEPYALKSFTQPVRKLMEKTRDNLPMALTGDFNGDSRTDLILFGKENDKSKILAFVSHKNLFKSYSVLTDADLKPPLSDYIVKINHTKIKFKKGKSRDAFQFETFGGAAREFYFSEDGFKEDFDNMIAYKKGVQPSFQVPKD